MSGNSIFQSTSTYFSDTVIKCIAKKQIAIFIKGKAVGMVQQCF